MFKKKLFLVMLLVSALAYGQDEKAVFAGGCFWSMQEDFDKLPGVVQTIAGYDGGVFT